ncbi:hypothetical protein SteCoe_28617 [Stentor coeruleus]|uniref:THIF-type NAD/FAD binding fold domain-containing protein n=1 Tax=Stentor coeruleus TaxID=5963 RepID=A0A1R2B7V0_9CILI|nr:hypothetical protein SteCoe_28617 [Stentor coeruleus]
MVSKQYITIAISFGLGALVAYLWKLFKRPRQPRGFPLKDQLVRNRQFFSAGQDKIENAFVVVVGLGGVGSHCVMALARSGVKKLRLIDFDEVTVSSLNRHAVACIEDVGKTKAETLKKYINKIIPHCEVDAIKTLFSLESASVLLGGNPDFVVDCIDNTNTKEQLIKYCKDNNLQIVSSGGAGGRIDPTRLEISDISTTKNCELIRKIRRGLHTKGIRNGVTMIFSSDHAAKPLLGTQDKKSDIQQQHDEIARFRARVMPVIGTMPAITGNSIAAYILSKLGGVEFTPLHKDNANKDTVFKAYDRMIKLEEYKFEIKCEFDIEDFENICRDLWKWRSCFSGAHTYVEATRWDMNKPMSCENIILLTKAEITKHLNGSLEWSDEQRNEIEEKLLRYNIA